jgi:phage-related protein
MELHMFEIQFYENAQGHQVVREMLDDLKAKSEFSKDARIQFEKTVAYIQALSTYGTRLGMPYIRHLEDKIWELRPLSNRILFFAYDQGTYVLLHHFMKKTQKTPRREIEHAKRNMKDYIERNTSHV